MPEWFWWLLAIWFIVRFMLVPLFAPHFRAPVRDLRDPRARRSHDAHDAAVGVAAVLGVRDGLHD